MPFINSIFKKQQRISHLLNHIVGHSFISRGDWEKTPFTCTQIQLRHSEKLKWRKICFFFISFSHLFLMLFFKTIETIKMQSKKC